jgi:hypothetical protein
MNQRLLSIQPIRFRPPMGLISLRLSLTDGEIRKEFSYKPLALFFRRVRFLTPELTHSIHYVGRDGVNISIAPRFEFALQLVSSFSSLLDHHHFFPQQNRRETDAALLIPYGFNQRNYLEPAKVIDQQRKGGVDRTLLRSSSVIQHYSSLIGSNFYRYLIQMLGHSSLSLKTEKDDVDPLIIQVQSERKEKGKLLAIPPAGSPSNIKLISSPVKSYFSNVYERLSLLFRTTRNYLDLVTRENKPSGRVINAVLNAQNVDEIDHPFQQSHFSLAPKSLLRPDRGYIAMFPGSVFHHWIPFSSTTRENKPSGGVISAISNAQNADEIGNPFQQSHFSSAPKSLLRPDRDNIAMYTGSVFHHWIPFSSTTHENKMSRIVINMAFNTQNNTEVLVPHQQIYSAETLRTSPHYYRSDKAMFPVSAVQNCEQLILNKIGFKWKLYGRNHPVEVEPTMQYPVFDFNDLILTRTMRKVTQPFKIALNQGHAGNSSEINLRDSLSCYGAITANLKVCTYGKPFGNSENKSFHFFRAQEERERQSGSVDEQQISPAEVSYRKEMKILSSSFVAGLTVYHPLLLKTVNKEIQRLLTLSSINHRYTGKLNEVYSKAGSYLDRPYPVNFSGFNHGKQFQITENSDFHYLGRQLMPQRQVEPTHEQPISIAQVSYRTDKNPPSLSASVNHPALTINHQFSTRALFTSSDRLKTSFSERHIVNRNEVYSTEGSHSHGFFESTASVPHYGMQPGRTDGWTSRFPDQRAVRQSQTKVTQERPISPAQVSYRAENKPQPSSVATIVEPIPLPMNPPKIDIDRLSRDVWNQIEKRIRIERERHGRL